MNGKNSSRCSGATTCELICDAIWLSPKAHASMITTSVVKPTDGLMPMTTPSARLHAKRRGVTPPRSWRSSGRRTLQRHHSRMDSGTSIVTFDADRPVFDGHKSKVGGSRRAWPSGIAELHLRSSLTKDGNIHMLTHIRIVTTMTTPSMILSKVIGPPRKDNKGRKWHRRVSSLSLQVQSRAASKTLF